MKNIKKKKYLIFFLFIILFSIIQVFFSTEIPKYMAQNIDVGIIKKGVENPTFKKISLDSANELINENSNFKEFIEKNYILENDIYKLKNEQNLNDETVSLFKEIDKDIDSNYVVQKVILENDKLNENYSNSYIIKNSIKMLIFAIISAFFVIISDAITSFSSSLFSKELRKELFRKIQYFSNENIEKFTIASLITRTTNDINQIQSSLNMILKMSIKPPILFVVATTQAYFIAPKLMKILIFIAVILLLAIIIALYLILPKISKMQKINDKINSILKEILSGRRVIRAFNKQKFQEEKFEKVNSENRNISFSVEKIASVINPFVEFMFSMTSIIIIYYTSLVINFSSIPIGSIFAFMQYSMSIMVSFLMFVSLFFMIPNVFVSYRRIKEVLDANETILYNDKLKVLDEIEEIEFKNVNLSYENSEANVLENISFSIKKGEKVGIIGSTGSGKSSIVKLIIRFLDVSSGDILINGTSIKDYSIKSLRNKIAYTPQTAKLFNKDILSNIAFNDENPDLERVKMAIDYSLSSEFADLNLVLNQNATNLSGGQKQRIQIARSIYKKADLIIFDDSFSALDNKTDSLIRKNLKKLPISQIIVAQKVLTIKDCDKIIVLNDGIIEGIGSHKDLIENCNVYREIYLTQKGGNNNE